MPASESTLTFSYTVEKIHTGEYKHTKIHRSIAELIKTIFIHSTFGYLLRVPPNNITF